MVLQPAPRYIDNAHNTEAFNASKRSQLKDHLLRGETNPTIDSIVDL